MDQHRIYPRYWYPADDAAVIVGPEKAKHFMRFDSPDSPSVFVIGPSDVSPVNAARHRLCSYCIGGGRHSEDLHAREISAAEATKEGPR